MPYVITQSCCNDATCVAVCPVDCIHPTPDEQGYALTDMLYVDPVACIECGACADACPVDAVYVDEELPEIYEPYLKINADYYETEPTRVPITGRVERTKISRELGTLRVAIVGSGPSACYAAGALLEHSQVEVDIIDRLPTPYGLVRGGVAPDHLDTKEITTVFERALANPKTDCHFNIEVGKHITHGDILTHHHAVIYAVGAASDRQLGIPGENLEGVTAATDFVAWYNGHPDFADRTFDLSGTRAVVVGNGNVALDVARILVTNEQALLTSDIAEHALTALTESAIREVVVIGRRGPAQASFTNPELMALGRLEGVDIVVDPSDLHELATTDGVATAPDPRQILRTKLLTEFSRRPRRPENKTIVLRFKSSPSAIKGTARAHSIELTRNELVVVEGRVAARSTSERSELEAGLILRSVGYRGTAVPGVPFDDVLGVIPNNAGRVLEPAQNQPVTGTYVAGWIKRGPNGVIGTNRGCSRETVSMLVDDFVAGRLPQPPGNREAFRDLIATRQPHTVDFAGWKKIDEYERARGTENGRPRLKLVDSQELIAVATDARGPLLRIPR